MPKRMFEKMSFPVRTAVAVALTAVFALALCAIFAFAAKCTEDPTANLTLYGEICYCVSMLFCGAVGAKMGAENKFASGIAAGGGALLVVAIAALILSDSFIKSLILAALGLFLCAAGSAVGSREVKRKRRR